MKRIAHLWTPRAIVRVEIPGDWPPEIGFEEWVYAHDLNADMQPLVRRGRFTGVEICNYAMRRRQECTEAAAELAGDVDWLEATHE